MELAELIERLQQGENLHTACKTWPVRPDDVAAALTAFANTDGGAIILGVDNSVEVRTPGQLPNSVTLEALRFGVHVLRNPTMYNLLLKVGLVTDAGSGMPRMIRLLREAIGREPEFGLIGNEFVVSLPRPQFSQARA